MYDMYEFNRPDARPPATRPARGAERAVTRPARAAERTAARRARPGRPAADALQVALDRRDNGGDAAGAVDQ
jgi:hypothetical protein